MLIKQNDFDLLQSRIAIQSFVLFKVKNSYALVLYDPGRVTFSTLKIAV
jgi:hypothetical protein